MKPILFPEGQKDFSTNGLGRLPDAISCKVTEERNGQYTSAVFYALNDTHMIRDTILRRPVGVGGVQLPALLV